MLAPEQARAARAWLQWTQAEFARRAKVGLSTVKDFESGTRSPITNNLNAMQQALEAAGVQLVFEGEKAAGITVDDARRVVRAPSAASDANAP
ncbi:MAG TPA: helix-turn-helix transcriptional regulator [Acetobacteraceae bacterium]|nr:helix-turn-helix transcriptional regulator [Acetobacteraceae bacterium]